MALYNISAPFLGLKNNNSMHTVSELDRPRLTKKKKKGQVYATN